MKENNKEVENYAAQKFESNKASLVIPDALIFSYVAQVFLSKKKCWLVNLAMSLLLTMKPLCSSRNLCCLLVKRNDASIFSLNGITKKSDYVCITSEECSLELWLTLLRLSRLEFSKKLPSNSNLEMGHFSETYLKKNINLIDLDLRCWKKLVHNN